MGLFQITQVTRQDKNRALVTSAALHNGLVGLFPNMWMVQQNISFSRRLKPFFLDTNSVFWGFCFLQDV